MDRNTIIPKPVDRERIQKLNQILQKYKAGGSYCLCRSERPGSWPAAGTGGNGRRNAGEKAIKTEACEGLRKIAISIEFD